MNKFWQQLAIATNWPVLVAVSVLAAAGAVSIWADSPGDGPKQLLFIFLGIGFLIAIQVLNYLRIGRYSWTFYFLSLLLVMYTVAGRHVSLPGVHLTKGACAWINFGGFSLEPSELTKISFVMVLSRYLRFRNNYRTLRGLLPPFALAAVPVILILKQPDLGVASIFVPTLLVMLFVAGAKLRHLGAIILIGLAFVPVFWLSGTDVPIFRHFPKLVQDYQRKRVTGMLSHDPASVEVGFQQLYAMRALGSGGMFGKGMGNIPVGRHVPEAHNDMIFAIIGEQFGFAGTLVILCAYVVLFTAGIEIAANTREPFGRLTAVGIVSMLAWQAMLNIAVAMRMFPVTGVTLPFVSYGGSSLLASFIAAGLLLNIGQTRPLVMAKSSFEY
jgi:rod shape determining protein RodA